MSVGCVDPLVYLVLFCLVHYVVNFFFNLALVTRLGCHPIVRAGVRIGNGAFPG